jgi:murein DD-endopeptidase MepM/ murein hydrolase activator NlpD
LIEAATDNPVRRTRRHGVKLVAALALAIAALGSPVAFAQSGGVGSPTDPTTTTDPSTTTPTTPAPTGAMLFPVAGPHTLGDGFGAARSGHTHQGQDIMAACGTPEVAVTRAKVKFVSFQKLAGNYVVIRNKKLHQDYMYAHLAAPAPVTKGQVVEAGQQIGVVGQTGDATACHLHFELWLGKWYRGGHPVDPLPYLETYQGF